MFNKRLINELNEIKPMIKKQVFYQWIALVMNIIFTMNICHLFVSLLKEELTINQLFFVMIVSIIVFIIRAFGLKKSK